jgi:hypothetical protein
MTDIKFETAPDGTRLAYCEDGGEDVGRCGLFWLGGFRSDMTGSKAEALASLARETRRTAFRFDYSGHGQSGGLFVDGTISAWLEQSYHMFTRRWAAASLSAPAWAAGWPCCFTARCY